MKIAGNRVEPSSLASLTWLLILVQAILITSGHPSGSGDGSEHGRSRVKRKSYSGYKLLRTEPVSHEKIPALENLESFGGVNLWTYPRPNKTLDIFTSPGQLPRVQDILKNLGLEHDVMFHDAEEMSGQDRQSPQGRILDWTPETNTTEQQARAVPQDFFSRYQKYSEIMNFGVQLAREYPSIASFSSIGKSFEGRDIGIMKISTGGRSKPGIFIDGGMHAREWIAPATVTFIMYKLLTDPKSKPLIDMFDWYIVPIVNVDGYEYTHTTDRYWRKTRSRSSNGCVGVDPNRNFAFHWAESGSSSKPCSDIYHGPRPFSEVETQALARTMMYLKNSLKLYLTFHAYSQMWLVPWGYIKNTKPDTYSELVRLANVGRQALEMTSGTKYSVGTAPDLLYPAAGGSDDWALGALGIPYSYCVELRDKGRYGFALPPAQIKGTGEETFNGVAAVARELYRTLKSQNRHKSKTGNDYLNNNLNVRAVY